MSVEEFLNEKLWPILVETVHALVMFPKHKAYVREAILPEKPETAANELAARLGMPLGEALVILHELIQERKTRTG